MSFLGIKSKAEKELIERMNRELSLLEAEREKRIADEYKQRLTKEYAKAGLDFNTYETIKFWSNDWPTPNHEVIRVTTLDGMYMIEIAHNAIYLGSIADEILSKFSAIYEGYKSGADYRLSSDMEPTVYAKVVAKLSAPNATLKETVKEDTKEALKLKEVFKDIGKDSIKDLFAKADVDVFKPKAASVNLEVNITGIDKAMNEVANLREVIAKAREEAKELDISSIEKLLSQGYANKSSMTKAKPVDWKNIKKTNKENK